MENIFKSEQLIHLTLTQYHRWYQVYEVPFTDRTIANHEDILSDDVEIISATGTLKGKDGMAERLSVYAGWKNAHHVQKTEVKLLEEGNVSLEADILYQNIRPDNSKHSYTIHYSTVLKQRENDLPVFTKISLQPTGVVNEFTFEDAYAENRVKSFMHYWLCLMERANAEKFTELLDKNFALHLSTDQVISDLGSFKNWVNDIPSKVKASTHQYKNLKVVDNKDNTFGVSVDFDWKGVSTENKNMIAETHHEWILSNNPEERFARMKLMKVTTIKPFQAG